MCVCVIVYSVFIYIYTHIWNRSQFLIILKGAGVNIRFLSFIWENDTSIVHRGRSSDALLKHRSSTVGKFHFQIPQCRTSFDTCKSSNKEENTKFHSKKHQASWNNKRKHKVSLKALWDPIQKKYGHVGSWWVQGTLPPNNLYRESEAQGAQRHGGRGRILRGRGSGAPTAIP